MERFTEENSLSERNELLISKALRTVGLNDVEDTYAYIVEDLYCDEAKDIYNFLKWLKDNDRPFGRSNSQLRWREYQNSKRIQ